MNGKGLIALMCAIARAAATPARAAEPSAKPAVCGARAVTIRGTVEEVDKENKTVTLKGPKGGALALSVQDPQKLEAVKVGDPVVARYSESMAIEDSRWWPTA